MAQIWPVTTLNIYIYVSIYNVVSLGSIPRMVSSALLDVSLSSYINFFIVMEETLIKNMSQ